MRRLVIPMLTLLLGACSSIGPDTAKVEDISIPSITPKVVAELPDTPLVVAGKLAVATEPLKVPGELYLPKNAATPVANTTRPFRRATAPPWPRRTGRASSP